ncbi:MAG: CdaR family protein [Eubacteriales bacterium]
MTKNNRFFDGIKHLLKKLGRILSNNLGLKIASVIFAIILWAFVMVEINPPTEKEFQDIDLIFENNNSLSEKELIIKGNFEDILDKVTIKIETDPDYLYLVTEDNIKAYVDLSIINKPGEQTVAVKATTSIGTVVGIEPSTVTLNVEDYITRTVPVTYEIKNMPDENYYVSVPVFTPESVDIKGARSFVEQVASAVCYIDLNDVTSDIKESMALTLRDEDGEVLDTTDYSEELPSVIVDMEVKPQKEVPISLEGAVIGINDVADGYIVTDYYVEPATVLVAAEKSTLDQIVEVQVDSVDITGAKTDLSVQTDVKDIDGVIITKGAQSIVIHVEIAAAEITQIFESVEVVARNVEEGFDVTVVPQNIRVVITDEELALRTLTRKDIKLYVDCAGLKDGEYSLDILFEDLSGIDPENVWLGNEEAAVVISKTE